MPTGYRPSTGFFRRLGTPWSEAVGTGGWLGWDAMQDGTGPGLVRVGWWGYLAAAGGETRVSHSNRRRSP